MEINIKGITNTTMETQLSPRLTLISSIDIMWKLLDNDEDDFTELILEILLNTLQPYKCVAIITDDVYYDVFKDVLFDKFGIYLTFFMIRVEESEDLLSPCRTTQDSLMMIKKHACQMYIVLIANGLQVSRLLRFGDRYRVLDTRSKFIMLHDNRLFHKSLHYLWKRIVNVVFIKEYIGIKRIGDITTKIPWFELVTVPFPSPIQNVFVARRLDFWRKSKFRTGVNLFQDKTYDLRNQSLRVVIMKHTPATTEIPASEDHTVRAVMGNGPMRFAGVEVEILAAVSKGMNFKCQLYETKSPSADFWGRKQSGGTYSGLIGEMIDNDAAVALGDLYYTSYVLELMDLSVPYNTECLTFLTPESLTDNSWKTLVLPFKLVMWLMVILCLVLCGIIFHYLALFHYKIQRTKQNINDNATEMKLNLKKKRIITLPIASIDQLNPNMKYILLKQQIDENKEKIEPNGLYLFADFFNSILYTYSMLLMVSLPKLPLGWSLRMLTGWYWLYCTLVVVSYRASMTAILANPAPRVTINTLQELVDSKLFLGGWGEVNKELFMTSLDPLAQIIGSKFEFINDSKEAVERIAQGKFAFYENVYFLKEASVVRQLQVQSLDLLKQSEIQLKGFDKGDRKLHIMKDCIISMPVSIGLQKNSPIKPRVDKYIRRVLEAGLIKKWLDDVMQPTLNAEIPNSLETVKALMNMQKFIGAIVALFIGYFVKEVEFLAEKTRISIIPTFNSNAIHLISGDIGPFRASLPVNVPLWIAINLKQQQKCKILPPDWMDVEKLEELKEEEKVSRTFIKMPSEHYMVEAKLLLGHASDDIPRADEIRTIIKDIWDIRMSKIRSSVDVLVKGADQLYRMRKTKKPGGTQSQNTSTFLSINAGTRSSTSFRS
ncbi:hypothetical protein Trydic_g18137 [Trypoxylus dichotomus]